MCKETAHGGTAIIIRDNIQRYERDQYTNDILQTTSITTEDGTRPLTILTSTKIKKKAGRDYNTTL